MKRRLRKKHALREFTSFGFEACVVGNFEDVYKILDEVIDFVESQKMVVGGGWGSGGFNVFVTHLDRNGSLSEVSKQIFEQFCRGKGWACVTGPLVDSMYYEQRQPGNIHPRAV